MLPLRSYRSGAILTAMRSWRNSWMGRFAELRNRSKNAGNWW